MKLYARSALATVSLGALIGLSSLTIPVSAQTQQPARQQAASSGDADVLQRADRDMRQVLQALTKLDPKPLHTLTPEEARAQPAFVDALKVEARQEGKANVPAGVSAKSIRYSGPAGEMPAVVYTPAGEAPQGGWPIIVYFHGGGWVIADTDTYEASTLALAKKANAVVVSVEYRHAPEHKFPAAHEDAVAAYSWVLKNAQSFGGDPTRVAVAGESAGGNLAFHVAAAARDGNFQKPAHMLLVYPVAGTDTNTPSYQENANAKPLNKAAMEWFVKHTISGPQDLQSPMLDIVGKANLKDLPAATIITAEIDPLMSEGKMLADKLKAAGGQVTYQNYEGVSHEFFGMDAVVADADRAQDLAARELKEGFAQSRTGSTTRR